MAVKGFVSFIKKIGDALGITKTAKKAASTATGMSEEELGKGMDDYLNGNLDDATNKRIEDNIKNLPGYDTIETIGKTGNWIKDQIEGESGAGANKTNKEIADQNLDFEREKFDYDKALQEKIFEREDTNYQRTANDMRLAGMNPLSMQSTNGAGQAIATTAPHNDYQMQSTQGLNLLNMLFNASLQAKNTASNNSLNQAQANLLNEQANNQAIKNAYEADTLSNVLTGIKLDNVSKKYKNHSDYFDTQDKFRNYQFNSLMGWTSDMPDWMKQSSARLGYKPFIYNRESSQELYDMLTLDPDKYWHKNKEGIAGAKLNEELSSKLLSDELLMGSLGVFGNILRLLAK